MTWRNPELAEAALQWRIAQSAALRSQRPISVRDEEASSPMPLAGGEDSALLQRRATQALARCLRINRLADGR